MIVRIAHNHYLKGNLPVQIRQAMTAIPREWQRVTLISYFIFQKQRRMFWITISMQQAIIMPLRARLRFQTSFDFPPYQKFVHPKWMHSFMSSIFSIYRLRKRLLAKAKTSISHSSVSSLWLVFAKTKRDTGVTRWLKRLTQSIFTSSLVFFLLASLTKNIMMRKKWTKMRKAWMFLLSQAIRTSSTVRLAMQRQMSHLRLRISEPRCSGSSNSRYLQLSLTFSKRRKMTQQTSILIWQCEPELMMDPKRQRQQPIISHSNTSMQQTCCERRGVLFMVRDMLLFSACIKRNQPIPLYYINPSAFFTDFAGCRGRDNF